MASHPTNLAVAASSGSSSGGTSEPSSSTSMMVGFARWRKPVSRLIATGFLVTLLLTDASPSPVLNMTTEVSGILLISAAVLGRIWCALYIAGRKNAELCVDGPYSLCRNPLYLFSSVGVVGFAFVAGSLPLGLALVPVFWGYHHFVIKAEEANLRALFGAAYAEYCARVPRIIPRPALYWSRTHVLVDSRIMLRALSEVAWFLIALALTEIIEPWQGFVTHSAQVPGLPA